MHNYEEGLEEDDFSGNNDSTPLSILVAITLVTLGVKQDNDHTLYIPVVVDFATTGSRRDDDHTLSIPMI